MKLAEVFKALGEPVRLRLFSLLSHSGEVCVCDLTEALELPQSTISRHLGVLRHAGLVSTRRDGKWMHYQMCDDVAAELPAMLLQAHDVEEQLAKDLKRLKTSSSC